MDIASVLYSVLPCPCECGLREWAHSDQSAVFTYTSVRSISSQSTTHIEPTRDVNSTTIKANLRTFPSSKIRGKKIGPRKLMFSARMKKKMFQHSKLKSQLCATKRAGLLGAQMFGSHSNHENCLFPPTLQTPPHPDLGSSSSSETEQRDACIRVPVNSQRAHGDRTVTATVGFCFNSGRHTCATLHISL